MIEALRRTRAVAVTVDDGTVYEAQDDRDDNSIVRKRKIRDGSSRRKWFTVPRAQFRMFARLGYHSVMLWEVTDGEYTDLLNRLAGLTEDERIVFAKENAVMPPDG
jgi:hypothetical protein